jgi:hypothetical protein
MFFPFSLVFCALSLSPHPSLYYFVAINKKSCIVGPHLTKGVCIKCLANSSYVVLPLPRPFHPVRLEAVILVSADHLQLDSRNSSADHRVRAMAFAIFIQEKLDVSDQETT